MIAIIDYGAGNLRSVANAFRRLGADVQTVSDPAALAHAEKIVLPGVGAFGAGMARLREAGFVEPLREAARAGTPLLGICLGLHYLFESSDEMGRHEGLGLLPGHVTRFPSAVESVEDHDQPTFTLDEGVRWHWTDERAEAGDAEVRAALHRL